MLNANTEYKNSIKIPLIVGVSGHIDILTPENEIEEQMRLFWEKLQELAGPETPVILLTSIAKGADHLAVKYRPGNVPYCVVLPFDEKEYRNDFSGTSLQEFEEDLQGAYKIVNCHAAPGDYAPASDYIRKRSDVLLTMWDGYESLDSKTGKAERGGTYYQIRTAFGMDDLLIRHPEKTHLMVNIPVERSRKGVSYHQSCGEKKFQGMPEGSLSVIEQKDENGGLAFSPFVMKEDSAFASILHFIRRHNERASSASEDSEKYSLRKDMENAKCAREMEIVRDDLNRHVYFDALAGEHQDPHKKQFFWIAVFSLLVGILGQAWGDLTFAPDACTVHLFHNDCSLHELIMHGIILLYLLGCAGVFLYGRKIAKDNHYFKYINPRIIAELLRLKIFWTLAGIRKPFTECILGESAGYEFMIPLCNWETAEKPLSPEDRQWLDDGKGLHSVRVCWLQNQANYFDGFLLDDPKRFIHVQPGEKKKLRKQISHPVSWIKTYFKKYERCEGYSLLMKTLFTGSGFFFAVVLILVFLLSFVFHYDHKKFLALPVYREFIVGICPFVVASLGWLLAKNNWDSLGAQYRETCRLFRKTDAFVSSDQHSVAEKQQIIIEMMQRAHDENTEWNNIKKGATPEPMG